MKIQFLLVLGLLIATVLAKPAPQGDDSENDVKKEEVDTKTVEEEEDDNKKVSERIDNEDEDEDEEDEDLDPIKLVGDAFSGLLSLLGTVASTAAGVASASARIATDPEVQESVAEVVDAGVKGTVDAVGATVDLALEAPKLVAAQAPLVEGLAKTISETSGFVGGSVEDAAQAAKVASVFAEAYTNDTLTRLDNFLKTFNRRLKCNTICPRKVGEEKVACEVEHCLGFVAPKTKAQEEEEELAFIANYDYDSFYDDAENDVEVDLE